MPHLLEFHWLAIARDLTPELVGTLAACPQLRVMSLPTCVI